VEIELRIEEGADLNEFTPCQLNSASCCNGLNCPFPDGICCPGGGSCCPQGTQCMQTTPDGQASCGRNLIITTPFFLPSNCDCAKEQAASPLTPCSCQSQQQSPPLPESAVPHAVSVPSTPGASIALPAAIVETPPVSPCPCPPVPPCPQAALTPCPAPLPCTCGQQQQQFGGMPAAAAAPATWTQGLQIVQQTFAVPQHLADPGPVPLSSGIQSAIPSPFSQTGASPLPPSVAPMPCACSAPPCGC